jgi:hypothetical protein
MGRILVILAGSALFLAGSVVFVATSQTVGGIVLFLGLALLFGAFLGEDEDTLELWVLRHRRFLLAAGASLCALGCAVWLLVHQDAGLLLVLLGGTGLVLLLIGAEMRPGNEGGEGPYYGDTGPGGFADGGGGGATS